MSRLWTSEEDAIALRCHANGESVPLIASRLQRSTGGVRACLRIISQIPITPTPPDTSRLQAIRDENARRARVAHERSVAGSHPWP